MEFKDTILLPHHLYRASVKKDSTIYGVYKRKNVLIVPEKLLVIDSKYSGYLPSIVYIDIGGKFGEDGQMYLDKDTFNFEKPTVSDIFEIAHTMNIRKSDYRYDFKTNSIVIR
jgi:hypothetical protein